MTRLLFKQSVSDVFQDFFYGIHTCILMLGAHTEYNAVDVTAWAYFSVFLLFMTYYIVAMVFSSKAECEATCPTRSSPSRRNL